MHFKLHSPKQESIFLSNKDITIAATGIQWGKSCVAVACLVKAMFTHSSPNDNFLVTSPTYKVLYQSTMPVFMKFLKDYGRMDKKNEIFELFNGGKVFFRTGTDPDSVIGITDIRYVVCDEAGLYTRYFKDNIFARSSIKEAKIVMVTSPYSLNWLYTDYIRKYKTDPYIQETCHLVQARSNENPYFPAKEYEKKQKLMDPRRFAMIYGGSFDKAQGLVYDCFDSNLMAIDPIKLPYGTRFFGGIDWGSTDPCAIKIRAVTEFGMHYSVDEVYQTQLHAEQILDHCARLKTLWGVERFYADPSRPDMIAYLNSHGIVCVKANNEIELGIERHYELIKNGRYQVFRSACPHTMDEYETYHYPEPGDLKPDQSQKKSINLPVDSNNHAMDTERYITAATHRVDKNRVETSDKTVLKPRKDDNPYERLKRLRERARDANLPI